MNDKVKADLAVQNFKKAFSGLSVEEQIARKWAAMSLVSTQKKNAACKQKPRF